MRVVNSSRARCRRGERKVAWSVGGSSGTANQGGQGQAGLNGSAGGSEAALKDQIDALTLRVEALEGILRGITNGDLLKAIGSVPLLEEVCTQTEELTGRSNALLGLLDTLDALNVLFLPVALPSFSVCPAQ
jgi:hypothetical protein